jgi:hypothetical protein
MTGPAGHEGTGYGAAGHGAGLAPPGAETWLIKGARPLGGDRIHDNAAINRRHDSFDMNVAVAVHAKIDNIGDVSVTKVRVARHAAAVAFLGGCAPAGFVPHDFENAPQASTIDRDPAGFHNVRTFE